MRDLFLNKKILVVGGAGFVGSALCSQLLKQEAVEVVVVDNLLSAEARNIPISPRLSFIYGSIADDRILAKIGDGYDYVFHLATYHGNQSSLHDPLADHQNNTITTLKLCELFKEKPLKKFVYASAGCTVAQKTFEDAKATTESDPVSLYLDSPYQISKIIGEFYGNFYWIKHQLPFVKARFQNVYGPREILGAGLWRGTPATIWRNVIPSFIWKALHGEPLTLERGGIATRDFIYVEDIASGLVACALRGEEGGVYNLASGKETSIKELAVIINKITQNPGGIQEIPARDWDRSGKRFADTSKVRSELNFSTSVSLVDGIDKTILWTKENYDFIKGCILKHSYFHKDVERYSLAPSMKVA